MKELCILNTYHLKINDALNLMLKVKKLKDDSIPDAFQSKFHLISYDYFTKNSMYNFKETRFRLKIT